MHEHFRHPPQYVIVDCLVRSFMEPYLFDNNVLFNNTTRIYMINLLWKLGLGLRLDLVKVALF